MIPYGRQEVTQADIDAVVDVLQSDFLTQGPMVPAFESAVAKEVNAKHAVAVNSATSALHIACLALGLGEGDWLWTTPITFVASANCGLYCGARVDFVDIDERTYNLCPQALEAKLVRAEQEGRLPKIIVAVHFAGQPCNMRKIRLLANKYGCFVIEDASHAIGASYLNEKVGSCQYSDIAVFSFHPVKIITTGEGGMAVTNDSRLAERMALLRNHGITRDELQMTKPTDGPWYYQQIDLGFNYRMTDIQASLGLSQLQRLHIYINRRRELANCYNRLLADLPIALPYQHSEGSSAWHLYVIRLQLSKVRKTHRQVFNDLRASGIGVNLHYIPVYSQPYYQRMGFQAEDYPNAEQYYLEAISLPIYGSMTNEQQDEVVSNLKEILDYVI